MLRRQNHINVAGWYGVMDGLENVTSITSLNGIEGLGGLFAGRQTKAVLGNKRVVYNEAVEVVSRLLLRNQETLEVVDLRWVWTKTGGKCCIKSLESEFGCVNFFEIIRRNGVRALDQFVQGKRVCICLAV